MARDDRGDTCLLGRGGSDTSAALFAALIGAEALEIWTDVPGLFTADPRLLPTARLIREIGYHEAQELAAMGAKVLHPRCLGPVETHGIPLTLHSTIDPQLEGTRVAAVREEYPTVHAVTCRGQVTLLTVSTLRMWGRSGFLARVFEPFGELGFSVDLVGTSQSAVSVTLDPIPGGVRGERFRELLRRLEQLGQVRVVHPCSVVSIVGRNIRAVLHELGPALEAFQERPVHLVSDSSEDLNLSFVVDEEDGPTLVRRLHQRLFGAQGGDPRLGATWEMIQQSRRGPLSSEPVPARWWLDARHTLIDQVADGQARFVYHLPTIADRARQLHDELPAIDARYYAMKANAHAEVLRTLVDAGLGLEAVSAAELRHARAQVGDAVPLLFTPNFCPIEEYSEAFELGAQVVVDGAHVLRQAPERFAGREIGLRVDPGQGRGHHRKVRTAGAQAKFGLPFDEVAAFAELAQEIGARVVGLHAHVGSGILDTGVWADTIRRLAGLRDRLPDVRWIDPGGGLGVAERPAQRPLELERIQASLMELRASLPGVELYLEPGRFLVSEAGVLVAPVTQVRRRAGVNFAGLPTGMNSLMRPALYGAWHGIHNLTRLDAPSRDYWHVVGPICESADVFGRDRWLPETSAGDVLLIENAGAYGAVMASRYNLRPPAQEVILRGPG